MKRDKCPICGEKIFVALVEELTDNLNPGKFVNKVSSRCNVPYTIPCLGGITVKYHYESFGINERVPYQERFVLFPYIVDAYTGPPGDDEMILFMFDDSYILRHVADMPLRELPWHDADKVRNKLKTMLVFS